MSERNRPRGPAMPPDDDPSIPVLTERLTLPALEIDFTLPPLPPAGPVPERRTAEAAEAIIAPPAVRGTTAAPVPPTAPRVIGEHAPASGADAGHEPALTADLRDAVLRGVRERLPQDVERLVRERFAPSLDATVRAALEQAATQLAAQVSSQLATQLATQLAAQLAGQLAAQVASQLAPQLASRLAPPLSAQVVAQVASQVADEARRALSAAVNDVVDHAIASELDRLRAGGR